MRYYRMMLARTLGIVVALVALGACSSQTKPAPARSTGVPFDVDGGELESPNSLPRGFTTINPVAPETGVVGVTHLPP